MDGRLAELKNRQLSDDQIENVSGGGVFSGQGYDNTTKPEQIGNGNVNGNKNPYCNLLGDPGAEPEVWRKPFNPNRP